MKNINFIKYIPLYFSISAIVIGIGLFSLLKWGLRPAVDFVGGSLIEIKINPQDDVQIGENLIRENLIKGGVETNSIQKSGEDKWIIRPKHQSDDLQKKIIDSLSTQIGETEIIRF